MPEHGWTRHGHRCCDQAVGSRPGPIARCGGPALCRECAADAAIRHSPGSGTFGPAPPPGDLHSRIAVEIERRLAVARGATPGPWSVEPYAYGPPENGWGPPSDFEIVAPDGFDVVSHQPHEGGGIHFPADAEHIAMADPADAERRYSAALRVLNRHRVCENGGLHGHAVVPWCDVCWTSHPCPEVLDVAAGLDITEGSTTDG